MRKPPLSPFSEVVDTSRRWTPDWYSWLRDIQERTDPTPTLVSKLIPPVVAGAGAKGFVLDSTVALSGASIGSVAVGGGANATPVWTDGLSWKIG